MLSKEELIQSYKGAKEEIERQNRLLVVYKEMYDLHKKMEYLLEKYPDLVVSECPERKGKNVFLSFCIERCTGKCSEWVAIKKHQPKLLEVVKNLNAKYSELFEKARKIKGLTMS